MSLASSTPTCSIGALRSMFRRVARPVSESVSISMIISDQSIDSGSSRSGRSSVSSLLGVWSPFESTTSTQTIRDSPVSVAVLSACTTSDTSPGLVSNWLFRRTGWFATEVGTRSTSANLMANARSRRSRGISLSRPTEPVKGICQCSGFRTCTSVWRSTEKTPPAGITARVSTSGTYTSPTCSRSNSVGASVNAVRGSALTFAFDAVNQPCDVYS